MQLVWAFTFSIQEVGNGGSNVAYVLSCSGLFNFEVYELIFYVWHHFREVHLLTCLQFGAIEVLKPYMNIVQIITRPSHSLLGIRTMVTHVHSIANKLVPNYSIIISKTIHYLGGSGLSSACVTASQTFKCSDRIPDGPPYQFGQMRLRDHSISSSSRTPFVTSKSSNITVMGSFILLL